MHGSTLPARVLSDGPYEQDDGLRNMFHAPDRVRGEMLCCPRFIDAATGVLSEAARADLDGHLIALAARIAYDRGGLWHDTLPGMAHPADNPHIPAGYTYLLQLIAHDMTDTGSALAIGHAGLSVLNSTRARPLVLDTIYGGGPDACLHAYASSGARLERWGIVPRERLRLGRLSENAKSLSDAPCHVFRDVARTRPGHLADEGLDAQPCAYSEALLADPRNDSHVLISQLTVLFHRLHNLLIDRLTARAPLADMAPGEAGLRRFACARTAVAAIYRAIIRMDVLPRILHPAVHAAYAANPDVLPLTRTSVVPLEFARGAFRFGHAMVRDTYAVNARGEQPAGRALRLSGRRDPAAFPMDDAWVVDWARMFGVEGKTAVPSRRIGFVYADVLFDEELFDAPMRGQDRADGLAFRDLLGAAYAGLWSVPALIEEFHARCDAPALVPIRATVLRPYAMTWQAPIETWLKAAPDLSWTGAEAGMTAAKAAALAADPPLPFFVQFEAAHSVTATGLSSAGQGRHLGPIGSMIVAETVHSVLRATELVEGEGQRDLAANLRMICRTLVGDPEALGLPDDLPAPGTMPDLLAVMRRMGGFDG